MVDTETILRKVLDDIVVDQKFHNHELKIKAINSGGANYTSVLYLATISSDEKEDLNLFAKVACVSEKLRDLMCATKLYQTEAFIYKSLAPTYDRFQEQYNVCIGDRFVFPKFFGCNENLLEETIVLENLVARGYYSYSRFKSIDWDHAASAVEVLAKLHALSFAYQKENPEEFERIEKQHRFEIPGNRDVKGVWQKMIDKSLGVLHDNAHKEKTREYFLQDAEMLFEKYNNPLRTAVLIHGDYRPSNLLFQKEGDKVNTMVVDFQTFRSGCPVTDLVYFEFMGSDQQFRAEHHDRLMAHYHQQLVLALERLGMDESVYPREEFYKDLKETLPYGVLLGVAILPIVTVEAENAPRVDGDADVNDFVVPPNELFAERFTGIVADCVRWGVI